MTNTLHIQIGVQEIQTLKATGAQMCFARLVNGAYSVVWQASGNFLESNEFSWTEDFALFGTNAFVPGTTVQITTNVVNINSGQEAALSPNGFLGSPTTGLAGAITLVNQSGPIHPGLNGSASFNGDQTFSPMFVAASAVGQGPTQIMPEGTIAIWFEPNVASGTMIAQHPQNAFTANLIAATNGVACLYQNGRWLHQHRSGNDAAAKTAPQPQHHQRGRH